MVFASAPLSAHVQWSSTSLRQSMMSLFSALTPCSSEGSVDGVSGGLDVNRFPGTMHDLRMFATDTE